MHMLALVSRLNGRLLTATDIVAACVPSRSRETEGWESWLSDQQQHSPVDANTPTLQANYEADTELDPTQDLDRCSTRAPESPKGCEPSKRKRSRKDSRWSIPGFLSKSRRGSKQKQRQTSSGPSPHREQLHSESTSFFPDPVASPQAPENTPSSTIFPLTTLTRVIPPTSEDGLSAAMLSDSSDIPHASFSSSGSSIASARLAAASPPVPDKILPFASPTGRPGTHRSVSPPPGRPEVRPYSSSEDLDASSTSPSSLDDCASSSGSAEAVEEIPETTVPASLDTGAEGRSLPIDIPFPHDSSHRSSIYAEATARPDWHPYHLLPMPKAHKDNDTSSLSSTWRNDHPDPTPASPSLRPTRVPSTGAMQALSLGPPERPLLVSSDSTERLVFRLSVEYLTPSTSAAPPRPTAVFLPPTTDDEDRPDFSLSHPALPSLPATSCGGKARG